MSQEKQLKVLISAFNFSPIRGSEFSVGWEWIRAIAKRHSVWAIVRESERQEIEAYLRDHPSELANVSLCFVPWLEPFYSGILQHIIYRNRYVRWQRQCYAIARELNVKINFDIVHHLTGTGFREPGFLWKLGKPFVWGPIGGLLYFRLKFLKAVPFRDALFLVAKNLTTAWMMHVAKRPRQAAFASVGIIAGTERTALMVQSLWKKRSVVISPVTPPELGREVPAHRGSDDPLRIIWCGGIEARKALNLLLLSLQRLVGTSVRWELLIIGTGPLEAQCRAQASDLGIGEHCHFLGRQPRDKVLDSMRIGHLFVHTSLYDGTATTIVEAMRLGLPPIGIDHCGFGDAVDERYGILIPPQSFAGMITGFAHAIQRLWEDEGTRYNMALAAQDAAGRISWEQKEEAVNSVYQSVHAHASKQNDDQMHSGLFEFEERSR